MGAPAAGMVGKFAVVWEVKDTSTDGKVPVPQEDRVVGCAPVVALCAAELTAGQAEAGGKVANCPLSCLCHRGCVAETDGSNDIDCVRVVFADGTVMGEQNCCFTGMPRDGAEANIVAAALQALRVAVATGPGACKVEDTEEVGGKNSLLPSCFEAS